MMQRPPSSSPVTRAAGDEAGQPKPKRPRAAQACDRCRMKKYKCDESYPCLHCRSKFILAFFLFFSFFFLLCEEARRDGYGCLTDLLLLQRAG